MGVEAHCTLQAWRERSSTGRLFTRCQITDDAPFLPDGMYEIVFAGQSVKTRKTAGGWELVFLSPEIDRTLWPPPPEN
jgi:hypothetical protein